MVGMLPFVVGAIVLGAVYVALGVRRAGELAKEGDDLQKQNRHGEALAKYDEAIKNDGANAQYHTGRGHALWGLGRRRDALEAYKRAAGHAPKSSAALTDVARALLALNRPEEACDAANAAISLSIANSEARMIRAEALWDAGAREDAVDAMRELTGAHDTVDARIRTAEMLCVLDRHKEEIYELECAVGMGGDGARLHHRIGLAKFRAGESDPKRRRRLYAEAVDSFERALERDKRLVEASMSLDYAKRELAGLDSEGGDGRQDP